MSRLCRQTVYLNKVSIMAKKLSLKLKKKDEAPAAGVAAPAAAGGAPAAAIPLGGSGGGIKLVLKDAKITIQKVTVAK